MAQYAAEYVDKVTWRDFRRAYPGVMAGPEPVWANSREEGLVGLWIGRADPPTDPETGLYCSGPASLLLSERYRAEGKLADNTDECLLEVLLPPTEEEKLVEQGEVVERVRHHLVNGLRVQSDALGEIFVPFGFSIASEGDRVRIDWDREIVTVS